MPKAAEPGRADIGCLPTPTSSASSASPFAGCGVAADRSVPGQASRETQLRTLCSSGSIGLSRSLPASGATPRRRSWFSSANGVLTVDVPLSRLYTPTTYIFIMWMIGSSLVLLSVAALFLRNQVKSLRRLAAAAEGFGKGRPVAFTQDRGRARSAPGGSRLHADARPHPAADPAAHRDARRGVARSAHAAHPHEARPRAEGWRAGRARVEIRCRRHGTAGQSLPRLCPRRGHRKPGRDRHRAVDR